MNAQIESAIDNIPSALRTYERMNRWFDAVTTYMSAMSSRAHTVAGEQTFEAGRAAAYQEMFAFMRDQITKYELR